MFTSPKGRPLPESNFRRNTWTRALAQAGLAHLRIHVTPHRRVAHEGGRADAPLIAKQLSHRDPTATQTIYSHPFGGERESIATLLDDLHSRATQMRPTVGGQVVQFPHDR